MNFVVTGKARANIRAYLKNLRKQESVDLGRRLLERELALLSHHLDDGTCQASLVGLRIVEIAGLFQAQEVLQGSRADQAAYMGGENAVFTTLHATGFMPARRAKDNASRNARIGHRPNALRLHYPDELIELGAIVA